MKHIIKKTIPILVILIICGLLFLGYNYALENLKTSLSKFSEENLNIRFSVGDISFGFPLFLELNDVKINDSIDIANVRFYPNLASYFFKDKLVFSGVTILRPRIKIGKGDAEWFDRFSEIKAPGVYFSRIDIHDGTLVYDNEGTQLIEIVKIKGSLKGPGFHFSKASTYSFGIVGFYKNKNTEFLSPLRIRGTIGMDKIVRAELECQDIKIDNFGFLYDKFMSSVVKEGRVDIKSEIRISKYDLKASCFLKCDDISLKNDVAEKINIPFEASFVLLVNFAKRKMTFSNIKSNLFSIILNKGLQRTTVDVAQP